MKKIFTLFAAIAIAFSVQAQCPLTTAVDFTVTDTDGNTHVLFDYLDDGKYVLIDFFYTTCGPCQITAPKVSEAYTYFGCNTGDLVVLGIDYGDTDAEVIQFEQTFGVIYPSSSGEEGGGTPVCTAYGITAYPTVILIAPDRSIVEQDIWPIENGAYIVSVVEPYGPQGNSCEASPTEIASYSFSEQTDAATIGDGTIDIEVASSTSLSALVPTFSLSSGASATIGGTTQVSGTTTVDFSGGSVTYVVTAEDGLTTQDWVVTVSLAPEANIVNYTLAEQTAPATINAENHTVEMTVAAAAELTALVPTFELSPNATTTVNGAVQESGTTAVDFSGGAVTYVVTTDSKTTQEWTVTVTLGTGISTLDANKIQLYPNPASSNLQFTNVENASISFYNLLGELVLDVNSNTAELKLDVSALSRGAYIVKIKKDNTLITRKINLIR